MESPRCSRRYRRWLSGLLLAVAGIALLLSVLVGHVNRTVLDTDGFATRIDTLRQQPAVRDALARRLTEQVLAAKPDLVAIRPLVEQTARTVLGSAALSPVVRPAAAEFQQALTTPGSQQIVLRLADVSALLLTTLQRLAPDQVAGVPPDLPVTLANVGGQTFAADTIRLARHVRLAAWVLPLLTLVAAAGAVALASDRPRGVLRVGQVTLAVAGVLAAGLVVGAVVVGATGATEITDSASLGRALLAGAWTVFVRPLWWTVGVLALAGAAVRTATAAVDSGLPALGTSLRRAGGALARPGRPGLVAARGLVVGAVGAALALDPTATGATLARLTGALAVAVGTAEVVAVVVGVRRAAPSWRWCTPAVRATVAALVGVGLLTGLAVWQAAMPRTDATASATGPVRGNGAVCNGSVAACGRRYPDVVFPATHNSMSAADQPGWFLAEQPHGLVAQLDGGVRALLFDVWLGQRAGSVVATVPQDRAAARDQLERELGPEKVAAAVRVADSVRGTPSGPVEPYLCHGLCEIGSTPLVPTLRQVRAWLTTHPNEVVTFIVEDHVPAERIGETIEQAGLRPYAYQPAPDQPWPTLRQMITSGRRLVVMVENGDGGQGRPWLVNAFAYTQDTPYAFPTVASFSCAPNRGPATAPLLLVNHWLSGFGNLVTDAQAANTQAVLTERVQTCRRDRGRTPTFLAVNWYDLGALLPVVDRLNNDG